MYLNWMDLKNHFSQSIIPGLVRTDIFNAAGGSDAIFDRFPHIQPKDIADGLMFALSAGPNVRVSSNNVL